MDDFQAPALQVLWQAVSSDPMNFQSWSALLSQVESVGSPEDSHRAYDEFLGQFPLCFGYWIKYANLARRHPPPSAAHAATQQTTVSSSSSTPGVSGREAGGEGSDGQEEELLSAEARRARAVFERAVSAAPFCLELWEVFAGEAVEEATRRDGAGGKGVGKDGGGGGGDGDAQRGQRVEDARRVLERALGAVGDNPRAGALWRRCVAFEEAQGGKHGPLRVTRLYEQAFGHRLEDLEALWIGFKEFVDRTPWEKLQPLPQSTTSTGTDEAADGGCEVADAALSVVASAEPGSMDLDKKKMLVKILEGKRKVSLRGRQRRESFERRIRRPHFHVKPLDDAQLSAWSQYLDFEMAQAAGTAAATAGGGRASASTSSNNKSSSSGGSFLASSARTGRKRPRAIEEKSSGAGGGGSNGDSGNRHKEIERLFERCLVPCASYWWLWERYALWKGSVRGLESALEVAERACSPFLRWRPEALFFRAELLERLDRKDEARGVYRRVLSEVAPGLAEGACKLACFERRCGHREAASAAYRSLLPPPLGLSGAAAAAAGVGKGGSPAQWEETTETTRPYLYMQLARFQHRVAGDPASARTTFRAAVADIPGSRELWLAFLEFEAGQPQALHAGRVEAAFRMAIGEDGSGDVEAGKGKASENGIGGVSNGDGKGGEGDDEEARRLTVEDRADLWEWFEEFVEDLSMDVAKVMSVRAEHRAWTRAHGMEAHEATAATAAADFAPSVPGGGGGGGGDPVQASQARDRASGGGGRHVHPAAASRTVPPPANPRLGQQQNAAVADVVGSAAWGLGMWAGGAAVAGGGGTFAPRGDQQRRDQWSSYYQQQQQQQQQETIPALPIPTTNFAPAARGAMEAMAAAAYASSPAMVAGFVGQQAARAAPELLQPHQLLQQQIDLQVQNQREMQQQLYGGGRPPLPQQQQQQHHEQQGWRS